MIASDHFFMTSVALETFEWAAELSIMPFYQQGVPMIRGIKVSSLKIGLIIVLIAVAALALRWLDSSNSKKTGRQTSTCNLQKSDCDWPQQGQNWRVSLSDITTNNDTENNYRLDIVAPGAPQPLLVVLRGESMYMGEYPVPLVRNGNDYYAEFSAPFCTTGDAMNWRLDLQKGMTPLVDQPPFRMVFQAY